MSFARFRSVEMSPGEDWVVYNGSNGAIAVPQGSDLLDRVALLDVLTSRDCGVTDLTGERLDGGGEGSVYRFGEEADGLVIKIPHNKDTMADNEQAALSLARYGGVCVERALDGLVLGGSNVNTPTYEAIITDGQTAGVIMSRVYKKSLRTLVRERLCPPDFRNTICRSVSFAVYERLSALGFRRSDLDRRLDVNDEDILFGVEDGAVDWGELTVVDALHTSAAHSPKLWAEVSV